MEKVNTKTEGVAAAGLYVKVMTDEQMELLRRQISVYTAICEKLVEMHKAISAQHDLSGLSFFFFFTFSLSQSDSSNLLCFNLVHFHGVCLEIFSSELCLEVKLE